MAKPATPGRGAGLLATRQIVSIAWQVAGSAASLAAALWVSWRFGLVAQGHFGLAKTCFDAAAVIGALGLPQGLLHLQYRLQVQARPLMAFVTRYGLLLGGVVAGAVCLLQLPALAAALPGAEPLRSAVLMSLPFGGLHLLARALLLGQGGIVVFGVATASPALLTLMAVVLAGSLAPPIAFEPLLLGVAITSAGFSWALAWRVTRRSPVVAQQAVPWPHQALWRVSLDNGWQAALAAALPAAMLALLATRTGMAEQLGRASLGLLLYQVLGVLASYLAPLVYDRAARAGTAGPDLRRLMPAARQAAALLALIEAALLLGWFLALPEHRGAWLAALLIVPAGMAAFAARLLVALLQARGQYRELSWQAAARLLLGLGVVAVLGGRVAGELALGCALLLVEAATLLRNAQLVGQRAREGSA